MKAVKIRIKMVIIRKRKNFSRFKSRKILLLKGLKTNFKDWAGSCQWVKAIHFKLLIRKPFSKQMAICLILGPSLRVQTKWILWSMIYKISMQKMNSKPVNMMRMNI